MKTKEQRYNELYSSGLVDSVKKLFDNRNDISEDYYVLMADYIDSMDEIKDEMLINPTEIARRMPELVKSIQETNLGGIYGRTDDNRIQINQSLNYEDKKLYFFHELTHALQTSHENGKEQCGFYDGHDGMFLTEGATQYTAEMLYNVSNGTDMQHRQQPKTVRGASDRTPYSPLSEYQYNGDILELLAKSMDLPLPQVLALAYKKDGRETLKEIYESMDGNQGKFDELMNNLEQIYSIDNLLIHGYGKQLQSQTPLNITMQDGTTTFQGNLNTYRELMNKTERELAATYIENHDTQYILQSYDEIAPLLTTPELKNNFLAVVHQLSQEVSQDSRGNIINFDEYRRNIEQPQATTQVELPEGYSINEFGEIIRPSRDEQQPQMQSQPQVQRQQQESRISGFDATINPSGYAEQLQHNSQQNEKKLSLKQRIAQFLQKNNLFMNMSFVEKFVHQQLDVLSEPTQDIRESGTNNNTTRETSTPNKTREDFINKLTNFGEYKNLPPIQRMSDPQKLEEMKRKMEQHTQENDNQER